MAADTEKWIDAVLATQAADGFFGPTGLRTSLNGHVDFWPYMPMTHALRSWAEFQQDSRIDPFLTKYFQFMAAQPNTVFTDGWGNTRWGDTLDVIFWLYNRTGDSTLLDLATRIHQNSANWVNNLASLHNVNFAQGFREPTQYWTLSGAASDQQAGYQNFAAMMGSYGQFPGGGFAGDEIARPGFGDPRQGFETCGIVEFMASNEILTRSTGDPIWADRTEQLAFNMLPAALDPQGKVAHYITSANSIQLDDVAKTLGQFDNGFAMQAYLPGVDQYRCCPHNYGQGWPYFIEEMWLATPDGGLAAALFGPSTVTAQVNGGTTVTVTEATSYPFSDTITFQLTASTPATFPFTVRIPAWCANPALTVNGTAVAVSGGPRFATISRTWQGGDTIVLRLPRQPTVTNWAANHNAVSVNYGPLTFSLSIDEQWSQVAGSADWPQYEVDAGSPWNFGLLPDQQFTVTETGNVNDPFNLANAPLRITAQAQQIPDWTADSQNVVGLLRDGPVSTSAPNQQITLIPMGAARLRITTFPQTGGTSTWGTPGPACRIQNQNSGKVLAVANMSTADSAPVVQYDDNGTPDHLWQLMDTGNGLVKVRNGNSGKVLGIDQMSTADSAQVVQFDDNGTADHLWRLIPDATVRIQNLNSTKVVGIDQMSTADSAHVVQFGDDGTADHLWQFIPDANGNFRIRNQNSGKVMGVDQMSTADSAQVVQFDDNGTADHLWCLLPSPGVLWRVRNANSGKVLGVDQMSYADSASVVQFDDSGTPDHLWRLL
ncbi:MAG TPA: RICIN domain-containing protein [Pseudonocardiaceae bacterium]|nr:RICIN domain-containing protein [Pseudonocardiaceae bacterium]